MIATVTSKGQVTLPAEARRRLGITAGTQLEFIVTEDGRLEVIPRVGSVQALKGILGPVSKRLTLDQMEKAISQGRQRDRA